MGVGGWDAVTELWELPRKALKEPKERRGENLDFLPPHCGMVHNKGIKRFDVRVDGTTACTHTRFVRSRSVGAS